MIVRTLAVQQPWAGLIANGTKRIEYRTWSTTYRGPVLIVASQGRDREGTEKARRRGELTETDKPKGATVCVVDLVDVVWSDANADFRWKLANPRLVPVTAVKGKLNLYKETVPDSWGPYFDPVAVQAKGPVKRAVPKRLAAAKWVAPPGARAAYQEALRTWRAAGCPDGLLCRKVVRAERAWKGPPP